MGTLEGWSDVDGSPGWVGEPLQSRKRPVPVPGVHWVLPPTEPDEPKVKMFLCWRRNQSQAALIMQTSY